MGLNTTPRTWVAGEKPPAATLNTEIRDAFTGIQAAWTSYTPSWNASTTNPALGNGTLTGAYMQIGKTIRFRILLTTGSTTTYGTGNYLFSLPVTAVSALPATYPVGVAYTTPAGTTTMCIANLSNSTTLRFTLTSNGNTLASTTGAWASGNQILVSGEYEAA